MGRTGSAARLTIGAEDTYNAGAAAPDGHSMPLVSFSGGLAQGMFASDELMAAASPGMPYYGAHGMQGDLVMPIENSALGFLMKRFLTTYAKSGGAAPYTHEFKIGATAPGSLWVEAGDATLDKWDQYAGVYPISLRGQFSKQNAMARLTWGLLGSGKYLALNTGADYDSTPTAYTASLRHSGRDTTVKVAGSAVTDIEQVEFTIERVAEPINCLDGNAYASEIALGQFRVSGSFTAIWDSADTYRALAVAGTEKYLEIISPKPGAATRYVSFFFQEVSLFAAQAAGITGPGPLRMPISFQGFYSDGAKAAAAVVTILNESAADQA